MVEIELVKYRKCDTQNQQKQTKGWKVKFAENLLGLSVLFLNTVEKIMSTFFWFRMLNSSGISFKSNTTRHNQGKAKAKAALQAHCFVAAIIIIYWAFTTC